MPKLKYNSTDVEKSVDPPAPGTYPMKVESCTYEEESSQGERIVVKSVMTGPDAEGKGKGYGFWDYVGLDVDWKVDQWLTAIGFDTESNPEGEFDTKDFVGKMILGRVKEDYYDGEYKPKLARALPYRQQDDEEGWDDESEIDESEEEEEKVEEEPSEDLPYQEDMEELGTLADDEDEEAIAAIYALCVRFELDPDEYSLWSEAAEAVAEYLDVRPKPPAKKAAAASKKAPAKKAAAATKKAASKEPEPEEGSDDDYESWTVDDLKAELEGRELSTSGNKTALIARLRKSDADPFD